VYPGSGGPYRYIEIRGAANPIDSDDDHRIANGMARKYMGLDELPPEMMGEGRVVIRVNPRRVITYGAAKIAEH
jgi:hypothetical protein